MSAEQSLVGAMGCASWRSHYRLREHAALAPIGGTIRAGTGPFRGSTSVLGLNEVGVTDLVMASIWRFGPRGAAYAVSPTAEANFLGADIAIIHPATQRVLLYQAKLAHLVLDTFVLKSPVTISQMKLLNRKYLALDGDRYRMSGRLALYQADSTPFIDDCPDVRILGNTEWWDWRWRDVPENPTPEQSFPEIGRSYYEEILAGCGCSPSGILASAVPHIRTSLPSVPSAMTWPWEFDTYEWLRGTSPLERPSNRSGEQGRAPDGSPEFDRYQPTFADTSPEAASGLAAQLAQQLRLPRTLHLYVVVIG
jgi:hypothetical protein